MMPPRKCHACCSGCPVAHALDIVGDKWTLLVLRQVMFEGQHEYGEMLQMPEKIATNILCDRLCKLVNAEVLGWIPHPTNKTKKLYYATEKGISLIPTMKEMILWAVENDESLPSHPKIEAFKADPDKMIKQVIKDIRSWNKEHGV